MNRRVILREIAAGGANEETGDLDIGRAHGDDVSEAVAAQRGPGPADEVHGFFENKRSVVHAGGDDDRGAIVGGAQPRAKFVAGGGGAGGAGPGREREKEDEKEAVHCNGSSFRENHMAAAMSSGQAASSRPPDWGRLVWTKLAIFWLPSRIGVNGSIVIGARGSRSWP